MPLSTHELAELKARVQLAHNRGYTIAQADEYVTALGGGDPPIGAEKGSTAHLLALIADYNKKKAPVPELAKPELVKPVPKAPEPPPPAPEPEPVKEPEPEPEPVKAEPEAAPEPEHLDTEMPVPPVLESSEVVIPPPPPLPSESKRGKRGR